MLHWNDLYILYKSSWLPQLPNDLCSLAFQLFVKCTAKIVYRTTETFWRKSKTEKQQEARRKKHTATTNSEQINSMAYTRYVFALFLLFFYFLFFFIFLWVGTDGRYFSCGRLKKTKKERCESLQYMQYMSCVF